MFQYSIQLAWSDEDEGYIATIPEFPNLSAFGENPEEAVKQAKQAANQMLEVLKEDHEELPAPRKAIEYSGQTRLRLPKSLHRALALEAEREGVSLNTLIVSKLSGTSAESVSERLTAEINAHVAALYRAKPSRPGKQHFFLMQGTGEGPTTIHSPYFPSSVESSWIELLVPEREEAKSATVKCLVPSSPMQRLRR
jgi:predicted RNase H-like HicB family nuclease